MSKVSDWLTFAGNDLKTARAALREEVTSNACFHAQQTVEKLLKSILLTKEQEIPKVHDLLFLLERVCKHSPDFFKFEEGIRFLNQFYVPPCVIRMRCRAELLRACHQKRIARKQLIMPKRFLNLRARN